MAVLAPACCADLQICSLRLGMVVVMPETFTVLVHVMIFPRESKKRPFAAGKFNARSVPLELLQFHFWEKFQNNNVFGQTVPACISKYRMGVSAL